MLQGEKSGEILAPDIKFWQDSIRQSQIRVEPIEVCDSKLTALRSTAQSKRRLALKYYPILKRSIDITFSLLGTIMAFPLMVLIAIAIKLDSPGPVLFRQTRVGKNRRYHSNGHLRERRNFDLKGKPFIIYKFRTMRTDADPYAASPGDNNDPRLTRVGKIIRRLCLDELPQLFNVLKGEMSLVGPRPEMPFIVQRYDMIESLRLQAKPGITGLWQLYGSRKKHIHENLHYDLHYIQNCCLWLDLKILLQTVVFILKTKNV